MFKCGVCAELWSESGSCQRDWLLPFAQPTFMHMHYVHLKCAILYHLGRSLCVELCIIAAVSLHTWLRPPFA